MALSFFVSTLPGKLSFVSSYSSTKTSVATSKRGMKGTVLDSGDDCDTESDEDDLLPLPFDSLPCDLKLQQMLERKMKVKLSKRVRLRRKKIVRKRRMWKKGRSHPSG